MNARERITKMLSLSPLSTAQEIWHAYEDEKKILNEIEGHNESERQLVAQKLSDLEENYALYSAEDDKQALDNTLLHIYQHNHCFPKSNVVYGFHIPFVFYCICKCCEREPRSGDCWSQLCTGDDCVDECYYCKDSSGGADCPFPVLVWADTLSALACAACIIHELFESISPKWAARKAEKERKRYQRYFDQVEACYSRYQNVVSVNQRFLPLLEMFNKIETGNHEIDTAFQNFYQSLSLEGGAFFNWECERGDIARICNELKKSEYFERVKREQNKFEAMFDYTKDISSNEKKLQGKSKPEQSLHKKHGIRILIILFIVLFVFFVAPILGKNQVEKNISVMPKGPFSHMIAVGNQYSVGLKADGTVMATGRNDKGQCDTSEWTEIIAVNAGYSHTVGLKSDGTVVATGDNEDHQCDVEDWHNIIAIEANSNLTVGVKDDGTIVATGKNADKFFNTPIWNDIIQVSMCPTHAVGLKADGTVVAVGDNEFGQCNISGWNDIVSIVASTHYTLGLKKDGTVVGVGFNRGNQCNVSEWEDIVAISANGVSAGVKKDGTVVLAGKSDTANKTRRWKNIVAVAYENSNHHIGLKNDGTLVVAGTNNDYDQCNIYDWDLW